MAITVLGEVDRVTYESEETGFRVVRLTNVSGAEARKKLTLAGVMPAVGTGTTVRVTGQLQSDNRYGETLRVESLFVVEPKTLEGLEKYLSGGSIAGIGQVFASRIVKHFGLKSLHVLDNESHRLAEVPGLGERRVADLRSAWAKYRTTSNTMMILQAHGASPSLGARIIERFGEKAAETVEQYPYRLALFISGIGFKTADRIARSQGLPLDHPERAQAGVYHQLQMISDSGHCYCERSLLVERTSEMLGLSGDHIESAMDALWARQQIVIEGDRVYLKDLHECESQVTRRISELLSAPGKTFADHEQKLQSFEKQFGLELADAQRQAVQAACEKKFLVVTGGPGVGKTTLVRAILHVLDRPGMRVKLAAPTGRAAKRLSESTDRPAVTLHRLLEVEGRGGRFARNEQNPLQVDILIIDEASMIDIQLARSLFQAIPNASRVIFVGDRDQLPSVGPGALLADLIASSTVPVARLDVIFRQAAQSGIIENSHAILRGEEPKGSDRPDGDFFLLWASRPEKAALTICTAVTERIPARFLLDPKRDIQVLCPMHRGPAGTIALNRELQRLLNPNGRGLIVGEGELREGDKVLQLKNDYDREVFNGDLGEIVTIDAETPAVMVRFEAESGARDVRYQKTEISQLTLTYASTIHKSQGSEYAAVVIPILSSHYVMLSRNLLYTAVTRAKQICVVVADKKALSLALAETRKEERATGLAERLKAFIEADMKSNESETSQESS